MKQKRAVLVMAIVMAVVAFVGVAGASYALWLDLTKTDSQSDITVGTDTSIEVTANTHDMLGTKVLVPTGMVLEASAETDEAECYYTVTLDRDVALSADLALNVTVTDLWITDTEPEPDTESREAALLAYIHIYVGASAETTTFDIAQGATYSGSSVNKDEDATIYVKVTIDDPSGTPAHYSGIAGNDIGFTLTFIAVNPT